MFNIQYRTISTELDSEGRLLPLSNPDYFMIKNEDCVEEKATRIARLNPKGIKSPKPENIGVLEEGYFSGEEWMRILRWSPDMNFHQKRTKRII